MKCGLLEAQGSSGGILILWDNRVWKGTLIFKGMYSGTYYSFEAVQQTFKWCLSGVSHQA